MGAEACFVTCEVCGSMATGRLECSICHVKSYGYCCTCGSGPAEAETKINGHVLRTHPEAVPEIVAKLARDPALGPAMRARHRAAPALWQALIDAMDASLAKGVYRAYAGGRVEVRRHPGGIPYTYCDKTDRSTAAIDGGEPVAPSEAPIEMPSEVGVAALRYLGLTHPADLARLGIDDATARRVLWPNHDDVPPSRRRRRWRCLACSETIEHRDTDCPACGGDTFEEVEPEGGAT